MLLHNRTKNHTKWPSGSRDIAIWLNSQIHNYFIFIGQRLRHLNVPGHNSRTRSFFDMRFPQDVRQSPPLTPYKKMFTKWKWTLTIFLKEPEKTDWLTDWLSYLLLLTTDQLILLHHNMNRFKPFAVKSNDSNSIMSLKSQF